MNSSRMYATFILASMLVLLVSSACASSADEVTSNKDDCSKLKSTIELKESELDSEPTESEESFTIDYRWHVWLYDRSCSPKDNWEVEEEESEVLRKCDVHEVESYKYAKIKVKKDGSKEVLYEYPCSVCHLHGVHGDERDIEIPSGGGIDGFDGKQDWQKLDHGIGINYQSSISAMFAAPEFQIGWHASEIENAKSFLSAYFRPVSTSKHVRTVAMKQMN